MPGYIQRRLTLDKDLKAKSVFLLGPRQTGKSSFIREQLGPHLLYNLLLPETFNRFNFKPQSLVEEIGTNKKLVVIDEIQRIPQLLNVIHYLIEEKGIRFLLTGSSARKLRSTQINLLGGRARLKYLGPFTSEELGDQFDLRRFLKNGLLPSHYFSDDVDADLDAYVGLYLQHEIANEGLTRNVPAFSRFLEVAALGHAEQISLSKIAYEAQVARKTLHEY
jgi:predicted AAA+ superfamily ATPase